MQFLADILKLMSEKNLITVDDLYSMSEADIIDKIRKCTEGNISKCFKIWENSNETEIHTSETCPSECIRKTFDFKGSEYVYMDFAIDYKDK